jgi:hypothetical protein
MMRMKNKRPPKPKIIWREQYIIIRTVDHGKRKIQAKVHDSLAIHKDITWQRKYVVTHVPTGLMIFAFHGDTGEKDAYQCAETLLQYGRTALKSSVPKIVKAEMRMWLLRWITKVKKVNYWVPTQPFRERDDER